MIKTQRATSGISVKFHPCYRKVCLKIRSCEWSVTIMSVMKSKIKVVPKRQLSLTIDGPKEYKPEPELVISPTNTFTDPRRYRGK